MASDTSSRGSQCAKPRRGSKTIARKLYDAAGTLPKKIRDEFRDYLVEYGHIDPPRRRKVHYWKRKKKSQPRLVKARSPRARPKPSPQIPLPLE